MQHCNVIKQMPKKHRGKPRAWKQNTETVLQHTLAQLGG